MPLIRRIILTLIAVFVALTLAACSNQPTAVSVQPSAMSIQPSAVSIQPAPIENTPTQSASTATPTPLPPAKTHYTIEAVLDYDAHLLQVSQQIQYTNRSNDPLEEIILMVDPLYFQGTFQLESLSWGDGKAVEGVETESGWLRLPLSQPLSPGGEITLDIAYSLNLPSPTPNSAIRPIPFGYTDAPDQPGRLVSLHPTVYLRQRLAEPPGKLLRGAPGLRKRRFRG